jgi:hypothetical protein
MDNRAKTIARIGAAPPTERERIVRELRALLAELEALEHKSAHEILAELIAETTEGSA